jgi:hypothetical protein
LIWIESAADAVESPLKRARDTYIYSIRNRGAGMRTMLQARSTLLDALKPGALAALIAIFAAGSAPSPAAAASGPLGALAGAWSGGGTVSVSNGTNERIRCRATYQVGEHGTSAEISLRCASDSASFNLQSTVRDEGGRITGTWSETSRNVSGSLSGHGSGGEIRVRAEGPSFAANLLIHTQGNRQQVSLRTSGGDVTGVDVALSRH